MLLAGVHDSIAITLQADAIPDSDLDTCMCTVWPRNCF